MPASSQPRTLSWGLRDLVCAGLIVGWGLLWLLPNLGHVAIHDWDEALHQVAARGTFDTFFYPHMYVDPLYPPNPDQWWYTGAWLLKPAGPLWVAAALMHVIGVTPLALRLVSVAGELCAALALYALMRARCGRAASTGAALGFLALPFGWLLAQGHLFGDVTDCALVGCVAVAMALLLRSIERDSWRWAAASGAAVGCGYLCKTLLALAPLGVAAAMCALSYLGFCAGPRLRSLVAMWLSAVAVALPWNLYAAFRWPEVYRAASKVAAGHIAAGTGADVGPWQRPVDAIFNEVNSIELSPTPVAVGALVLAWLVYHALRRRETATVAVALWLGSTWTMHSLVSVKAPAHVWNAAPAVFAGLALMATEVWRSRSLGGAVALGFASPWLVPHLPVLARLRSSLPEVLQQTRAQPGLAEGVVLIALGAVTALALGAHPRARPFITRGLALIAGLAMSFTILWRAPAELMALAASKEPGIRVSYTRELGRALDRLLPPRSVLWQGFDRDPHEQFETQNLMFWSGRMSYRRAPDVATAREKGYRSYLISPKSEPFAPVEGVPAHAWLRAYDAEAPAAMAPLPFGVTPADVEVGSMRVVGFASGRIDSAHDRWAFYVQAAEAPTELTLVFHRKSGAERHVLAPELSLVGRESLAGASWFILPVVGPPRSEVAELQLGRSRRLIVPQLPR